MVDIKLDKQLPVVQMNFIEVKASLIAGAEKYRGILVTEESLKDCKIMQKELSKTKTILDAYRKTIKKEMIVPITKFEEQCKSLIELVAEVEAPIKEAILVFDNEARETKRVMAQEHIDKLATDLLLNDKYSSRLIVSSEYLNVSMSVKKVKEDIEARAFILQQEQNQEIENIQIIKNTIETVNKGIDAKISFEDFETEIKLNPVINVIANINARAERIKANELKAIEDRKAKAEKEVLERIAKAEREATEKVRVEERNVRIAKEEAAEVERLRVKAIDDKEQQEERLRFEDRLKAGTIEIAKVKEIDRQELGSKMVEHAKEGLAKEKLYFIDMKIINATLTEVKTLSQFLKDNNYKYETTNKGLM